MKPQQVRCETCVFWHQSKPHQKHGQCRRNPPSEGYISSYSSNWCGEWRAEWPGAKTQKGRSTAVRRWTDAERETARAMAAKGHTYSQIADALPGRTLAAVTNYARYERVTNGRRKLWTDGEVATLTSMWAVGAPIAEIAAAVGRTYNGVVVQRMHLGLPPRRRRAVQQVQEVQR